MPRLLLLLGAESYRAPDFVAAARKLSVDLVVGTDAPSGASNLSPGQNLVLPFQDANRATELVLASQKIHPFAAVVAADDTGVVLAAKLSQSLGLKSNPAESAISAANKAVMRDILQAAGLPGPWYREVPVSSDPARLAREMRYPCVLKPLFLSASRGVIRANDAPEFVSAFSRIARILADPDVAQRGGPLSESILVEEFIPGAEVSLEGMLIDGTLKRLALFDKPDPLDGPYFEETLYITPSRHPEAVQQAILAATSQAAEALGLHTGPIHAELRLRLSGSTVEPTLVELAARSIGGHCSRSLVFGAGMSLEELILRQTLGLEPGAVEREHQASGVMMLPIPKRGILRGVKGKDEALSVSGIQSLEIGIPIGQPVVPLPEGHRYLGFMFAKGTTPAQVEGALREALARLIFEIDDA